MDSNEFEWDPAADPPSPLAQENMHPAVIDELKLQLGDLQELQGGDLAGFLRRGRT